MSNNILSTTDQSVVNDSQFTHMVTLFGQWNDHDLTFTPFSPSIRSFSNGVNCEESCEHTEPCIPIPVSGGAPPQTGRCGIRWKVSVPKLRVLLSGRSLLATPASTTAPTTASHPSDLPLPAEPDSPPTILVENPTGGSR